MAIASAMKALALALGFDLAGVTPAVPGPRTSFLRDWLARGYGGPPDGPLAYLVRAADVRIDPTKLFPGVQSFVVVALSYASDDEPGERMPRAPQVARYARGEDYHEVMSERLRALASGVEVLAGRAVEAHAWVDRGPVLERVVAAAAGLGWIGKNTMLIHPKLGSYVFLGVLATDVAMGEDERALPEADHCGACRACLDACPTDAFPEPYVLDATRCIAYTTIEDPGPIPADMRVSQRHNLFGCDVCQEVCPWNRPKRVTVPADPLGLHARLAARETWRAPTLAWLLGLGEEAWLGATRSSAMRRTRRRSLLRNALIVAGNSGDASLRPLLEAHADGDDPLLAEHARWSLGRLRAAP